MKLTRQKPVLLAVVTPGIKNRIVSTLAEAHGMSFRCPGAKCSRSVVAWFDAEGTAGQLPEARFAATGTSTEDLTLDGTISPGHRCGWSGTIAAGEIETSEADPSP